MQTTQLKQWFWLDIITSKAEYQCPVWSTQKKVTSACVPLPRFNNNKEKMQSLNQAFKTIYNWSSYQARRTTAPHWWCRLWTFQWGNRDSWDHRSSSHGGSWNTPGPSIETARRPRPSCSGPAAGAWPSHQKGNWPPRCRHAGSPTAQTWREYGSVQMSPAGISWGSVWAFNCFSLTGFPQHVYRDNVNMQGLSRVFHVMCK